MITLNRADIEFLLRQVTINYLAPDPNNPGQFIEAPFNYSALANAVDPSGVREVSGANNNIVGGFWDANTQTWVPGPNTSWGQADQPFLNQSVGQAVTSAPESAYNTPGGAVADTDPRIISNLVATMFTTGLNANPAIVDAATNADPNAQNHDPDIGFVANAGVLGGGRYNGWFVAFGQFFDHGLDFVLRDPDPTATITVNLSPTDPLYDPLGADGVAGTGDEVTSIRLRRADVANPDDAGGDGIFGTTDDVGYSAGADGLEGTADDVYAKAKYVNNTGLLIDQSQTYGSHASVNALIREYDANGDPTGRVVAGNTAGGPATSSGLATWADIKTNAERIGVDLDDTDIHNAPVLRTDPTGKLMFDADSAVQWKTTDAWYKQILLDNPGFDISTPFSLALQSANDPYARDANGNVQFTNQNMLIDFNPGQSLDSHIITGDGRANENIGLTAVHHVFHEEHNALVGNIQASIIAQFNEIAATDPAAAAAFLAPWQSSPGVWDGEKLYQAARLVTESEYNHIAIDQYVGTLYGALPEFVSYSSDINMGVSLEFSQAVFRLGHSMLTETFNVDVANDPNDPSAGTHKLSLLEAFVNPELYSSLGPQALALGLTTTLGNEVDEFVTPALQQSLLGQPLDLATINIARGRDVGLPTWNEFRQQVYDQLIQNTNNTNGSALAPYTNWADIGVHLKNEGTLVNFIAAYARGDGDPTNGDHPLTDAIVQARADYASGAVTIDVLRNAAQALYDAYLDPLSADHAEAVEFMQGTPTYDPGTGQWTFAGADQGFWDIDLWIGGLAERPLFDGPLGTTFSYVILDFAQRQQDGDRFYYLFRTPMGTHLGNEIIENQFGNLVMDHTGLDHLNGEIFIWANANFTLDDTPNYFNAADHIITDVDGADMVASDGHLVIAGLGGDDYIAAGLGDDTIYGDAGNDQIYGSQGNDHLFGGEGNDYIFDDENDDFITGGAGNDRIFAGPGAIDTVFGDEGDDEIHGGDGIDELLGGTGDDMIYGDGDTDVVFGEEGNDYLEGGDSVDEMQGQEGNDWMRGGVGDDHLMGGDGNDLLEGGVGPTANDGDRMLGQGVLDFALVNPPDLGFDVSSYEDVNIAITANLHTSNENGTGGLLDTYAGIEGLVGSRFNDNLTGAGTDTTTSNGFDNMLVGGAGNDLLTGLSGDDQIFGDGVVVTNDLSVWDGVTPYTTVVNWKGTGENRPDFGALGGLGHFLGDNGTPGSDTAVFSGNCSDYTVTQIDATTVRLVDNRGIDSTAIGDLVKDTEFFRFADGDVSFAQLVNQTPTDIQWNATSVGNALPGIGATIANLSATDPDNSTPLTYTLVSATASAGNAAIFNVSSAGVVTLTGAMAQSRTYDLVLRVTDAIGASYEETFRIRTNGGGSTDLTGFATVGDDIMYGLGGGDTLAGDAGNDTLFGQTGNDTINGGAGNDTIKYTMGHGADTVDGGTDADTLDIVGTANAETLDVVFDGSVLTQFEGGSVSNVESIVADMLGGTDTLNYNPAGAANTTVGVTVNLAAGTASGFTSIAGIDNVTGGSGGDTLTGDDNANVLIGGANGGVDILNGLGGGDTLDGGAGGDTLDGGAGGDTLTGGAGIDTLTGGTEDDIFDFNALSDSGIGAGNNDIIMDFQGAGIVGGDIIDLSGIDAIGGVGGNQAFTFIGGSSFTAAGQLRIVEVSGDTYIQGNTNGNVGTVEFEIRLAGSHALTQDDFIL